MLTFTKLIIQAVDMLSGNHLDLICIFSRKDNYISTRYIIFKYRSKQNLANTKLLELMHAIWTKFISKYNCFNACNMSIMKVSTKCYLENYLFCSICIFCCLYFLFVYMRIVFFMSMNTLDLIDALNTAFLRLIIAWLMTFRADL